MIQRCFEKLAIVLKSTGLFALLFISACASQQTKDSTIDEQIETMKMIEETEQNSASVFVQQDMGLLSLHERNEKEALTNLQNEIKDEQLREPANEEEVKVKEADVKETEVKIVYNQENKKQENTSANEASSWSTAKVQTLSKEEMSQELFEADTVIVQKGDSLSALAQKHLGNKKSWARIWSINPNIQNPNIIEVGTKLYMPKAASGDRGIASVEEKAQEAVKKEEVAEAKEAEAKPAPEAPLPVQEVKPVVDPIGLKPEKLSKASVKKKAEASPVKIQDLAPTVEAKKETSKEEAAPVAKESAPAPLAKEAAPAAKSLTQVAAVVQGGSSHTTDELLIEHLETKRAIKFKGKDMPPSPFPARKISSVNDMGPDEEAKVATATAPKGLARVISFAGLLIMAAVLAGFFFSKPKNQ